jgi:hypothetical protein
MWIAQVVRFWRPGGLAWIGLVVVAQNIVGSLFNSFIFDFTEGWIYAFGVGVMAGILKQQKERAGRSGRHLALDGQPLASGEIGKK